MSLFGKRAPEVADVIVEKGIPEPAPAPRKTSTEAQEEQERIFAEYEAADLADQNATRDWTPEITVRPAKIGVWIGFGKEEFPAPYVEKIACKHTGSAPQRMPRWKNYTTTGSTQSNDWYATLAYDAQIEVTMFSGRTIHISISRHKVDIVLAELIRLWREHR